MEHIHEKLTRQITLTMPEATRTISTAHAISTAFIERIPLPFRSCCLADLSANF